MAKPKYGKGSGWCRRGQHYANPEDIKLGANGQKYCKEHKFQIRCNPRDRKWKARLRQYNNTLKTQS